MFKFLKVSGDSMHPTLESGAFVLVWKSNGCNYLTHGLNTKFGLLFKLIMTPKIRRDDIAVIIHPRYGQIIKRVVKIKSVHTTSSSNISNANKVFRLRGDNLSHSVSEEDMGWVEMSALTGKVIYVIKP